MCYLSRYVCKGSCYIMPAERQQARQAKDTTLATTVGQFFLFFFLLKNSLSPFRIRLSKTAPRYTHNSVVYVHKDHATIILFYINNGRALNVIMPFSDYSHDNGPQCFRGNITRETFPMHKRRKQCVAFFFSININLTLTVYKLHVGGRNNCSN